MKQVDIIPTQGVGRATIHGCDRVDVNANAFGIEVVAVEGEKKSVILISRATPCIIFIEDEETERRS